MTMDERGALTASAPGSILVRGHHPADARRSATDIAFLANAGGTWK
jgi:hypothetical protein